MSIHVVNPELEMKLAAQRRNSTIASLIIGSLLVCLLALIFWAIGIKLFSNKTPVFETYISEDVVDNPIKKAVIMPPLNKQPSPSQSPSDRLILPNVSSEISIPEVDVSTEPLVVEYSAGSQFGDGFNGSFGDGKNSRGGNINFFVPGIKGERICFVIDYSQSMKRGNRIALLKAELEKTISELPAGLNYQLIFFAGPTWVAGSNVSGGKSRPIITSGNKTYKWSSTSTFDYAPVGDVQPVEWLKASPSQIEKSLEHVRNTPLIFGTSWESPIEMALQMSPKPDEIVFLTDGDSGKNTVKKAKKLAALAAEEGVVINAISLMHPKAWEAMKILAELTGGMFALIDENGNKVEKLK